MRKTTRKMHNTQLTKLATLSWQQSDQSMLLSSILGQGSIEYIGKGASSSNSYEHMAMPEAFVSITMCHTAATYKQNGVSF